MDDQEFIQLIERIREGDDYAFADLWAMNENYAFYLIKNLRVADEDRKAIINEVTLKIWRAIKKSHFNSQAELRGYISKTVFSCRAQYFREQYTAKSRFINEDEAKEYKDPNSELPYIDFENKELIQRILELLPYDYRQVIELNLLQGLDQKQISNDLGISLTLVSTRIDRAKKKMRAIYKKLFPDDSV